MSRWPDAVVSWRLRRAAGPLGLVALLVAVAPFVTAAFPVLVGAEGAYVVTSGSMEPAIGTGAVVYVYDVDAADVQVDDVITYDADGTGQLTTHRVVEVLNTETGRQFQTQGDANEDADPYRVPAEAVVGRVAFSVPWVGRVIAFASTRVGAAVLLIAPTVLLVLDEAYTLGRGYLTASENEPPSGDSTESATGGDD